LSILGFRARSRPVPISTLFPYTTLFRSSGKPVGDDDRGASFHHARERGAHPKLSFGVYAGGSFVEHQDFRIVGQRPRKRNKLLLDRKSTRLNSSHRTISYAVFCLKKKN